MKELKNIAIVGSFGTGNIGDEAAWISVKQFLIRKNRNFKFNTQIFHWSHYFLPCGHLIEELHSFTNFDIDFMNNNFSAIIITGGGIIGSRWGLTSMPRFHEIFNKLTIPIYCISISVEKEFYSEEAIKNIKLLIRGDVFIFIVEETINKIFF